MDNHLALEPLLIARLKEQVTGFRDVLGMADLAAMQEASQITPAAHVIYQGDTFPAKDGGGKHSTLVEQTWLVVVAVRNVRDTIGGAAARVEAGELITQTLKALSNWRPEPELRPLVLVNPPKPGFNAGFAYFPLAFKFVFYAKGVSCESN